MGKLIKRIPGLCLLISSLPDSALRSLAMSTSILKALPGKLDIKGYRPGILYILCTYNLTSFSVSLLSSKTELLGKP